MENLNSNIMITYDQIKATKAFQSMSKIKQKISLNRNNRTSIENCVNICKNVGLDQWKKQTSARQQTVLIVEEIYNTL